MRQGKVLEGLKEIGGNKNLFGLNNLREWSATVATNLGVKDKLFKKHQRWKTEKVKKMAVFMKAFRRNSRLAKKEEGL